MQLKYIKSFLMTSSNGNPMILGAMYHGWLTPIITHCYHLLKNAYKSHNMEQQFFNELVIFFFFALGSVLPCQSPAMKNFQNYLTYVFNA